MAVWYFAVCLLLLLVKSTATRLSSCDNQVFEVVENETNNQATCSDLGNQADQITINWKAGSQGSVVGICPPLVAGQTQDTCQNKISPNTFNPVRTTNSFSVMTIDGTSLSGNTATTLFTSTLVCQATLSDTSVTESNCSMDYIYKPEFGSCTVEFTRWAVSGSCSITKFYSARNRYACQWHQQKDSSSPVSISTSTLGPLTSAGGKYKASTCTLMADLPTQSGSYTYTVHVTPGSGTKQAVFRGTFTNKIVVPVAPTASCSPSGFIPENTNISCTCHTENIGTPSGTLMWFRGAGNSINFNINNGNFGDSTLQMEPQKVVRADHNSKKFRCDVDWNNRRFSGDAFTVSVGYPPSQSSLKINSVNPTAQNVTVTEGEAVTFECSGSDGRPPPNVSLTNQSSGSQLASGPTPVTHPVTSVRCEDFGHYICTAGNDMGQPATTTVVLHVNCKPRSRVFQLPSVTYMTESKSVFFDVTAYPVPDVKFAFLGKAGNSSPQTVFEGITLSGSCQQTGTTPYRATCSVTVKDMKSSAAAGFYQVTVSNSFGQLEVAIEIKYKDSVPKPVDSKEDNLPSYLGATVGLSVVLVLLVMLNAAVVVWIWRHHWILPCADKPQERSQNSPQSGRHASDVYENPAVSVSPESMMGENSAGAYDGLTMSDVGLRSTYSGIEYGGTSSARNNDSFYQNTSR